MTIVPEHHVPCRLHFKGVFHRFNVGAKMSRAEPAGMDGRVQLMSNDCVAINGKHFYGQRVSRPAIALGILVFLLSSAVRAESGFVRVNQLGYELGAESRAYLMANGSESGATFEVRNSGGKTVCSKPIGSPLGQWGKFTVYSLDFQVDLAGTYTIEVDGPFPAVSPSFRIDTAEHLYSQGIAHALHFYQNERDGDNFIKMPLRTAPGHLNDHHGIVYASPQFDANDLIIGDLTRTGAVLDVSGGWWDAGDYLKFVQTHSYVIALMLMGIRDFPKQMGSSAGRSNFTNEAEFGLRWLEKMWDDDSRTLYYQVGIGTDFENDPNLLSDHDLWRLPQADDTIGGTDPTLFFLRHRPVFLAGPAGSKISPNLAGRLAADFAGCYQVFRKTHPVFADKCLVSAEHIFDLADTSPTGDLLTTAPFDFYGETEWRDDMELGATQLYFALANADDRLPSALPHTDPIFYLRKGAHWAHAYITGPNDASDTLNLYDVSGVAHFELFRAIAEAGHPGGLEATQSELVADLRRQLENAIIQGNSDPFGFGFPWDTYDTTTHGAGLSVVAREYALLTKSDLFDSYSRRWEANILGANAWGTSLIVGDGETFPNCMQHQVANILGSLDGAAPILFGALVEGPNSFAATGFLDGMRKCPPGGGDVFKRFNANGAIYKDDQQSYSTVEPAIDLTAASFLMFAWRIARSPATLNPSGEFSTALDQAVISKPQAQWPVRRKRAKPFPRRSATSPQPN
jgi:endoglucanase